VAVAVPDLPLDVLAAAEQQALGGVAGHQHQHRLGLTEAGEVIEVAVEAVAVVGVAVAHALGCGGPGWGDVEGHGVAGSPG
jgi:hypothetical protein